MARPSDLITLTRQDARDLWRVLNSLLAYQREWIALDHDKRLAELVEAFDRGDSVEDPFAGANDDVTTEEIRAFLFDTVNAFMKLLDDGHATNIATIL